MQPGKQSLTNPVPVQWTVASDGLTEPNLYLRSAQMQTNLQRVTKTPSRILGFWVVFVCFPNFIRVYVFVPQTVLQI